MEANIIMDPSTLSTPQVSSRKRNRENETPSQRIKREKAAERQRRKRERDRLGIPVNYVHPPPQRHPVNQIPPAMTQVMPRPSESAPHNSSHPSSNEQDLTPEEEARRDRVRAAARDRQRKHRALVKQKKLRELGVDMGNDLSGGAHGAPGEESGGQMSYPVDPQNGFHPGMISSPPSSGMVQQPMGDDPNDNSFTPNVNNQGHGGQMFAATLLLSFSCAPLLKQHLLSSLQMSNDELASLEPMIADAWDQWDRQRRQHQQPFDGSQPYTSQHPFVTNPQNAPPEVSAANEFRARFHRSLVVPTPFQAQAAAAAAAVAQAQANAQAVVDAAAAAATTVSGSMNGVREEDRESTGQKSENS